MKIKPAHYNYIKQELSKINPDIAKQHYKGLKQDARVKDINMRFRWDCFHYAGLNSFQCNELYPYLNDTHIDTALKSIVAALFPHIGE